MLLKWRNGQFGPSLAWCRCACMHHRHCPEAADPGAVQSREEQLEGLHPKLHRDGKGKWYFGGTQVVEAMLTKS